MIKSSHVIILCFTSACGILLYCAPLHASEAVIRPVIAPQFKYATPALWQHLRRGLNYLESPKPLSEPEAVHPSYLHPDASGYGPYGLSPGAYKDVQRLYPYFRQYSWQSALGSPVVYDLASQAYADWLLGNLQMFIPQDASVWQVFDVLHKAWNLGLAGFKSGRQVVASRARRAKEFTSAYSLSLPMCRAR